MPAASPLRRALALPFFVAVILVGVVVAALMWVGEKVAGEPWH